MIPKKLFYLLSKANSKEECKLIFDKYTTGKYQIKEEHLADIETSQYTDYNN